MLCWAKQTGTKKFLMLYFHVYEVLKKVKLMHHDQVRQVDALRLNLSGNKNS